MTAEAQPLSWQPRIMDDPLSTPFYNSPQNRGLIPSYLEVAFLG